jgi:TP901 family phage tail tape measure protein
VATRTIETRAVISAQDKTGATFAQVASKLKGLENNAASASRRMDSLARGMSAVGSKRILHDSIAARMSGGGAAAIVAGAAAIGPRSHGIGRVMSGLGAKTGAFASDFANYAAPGAAAGAFGLGAGAVAGLGAGAAGVYGIRQAISFDKAMADVKKKVNLDAGASYKDVEKLINQTARAVGMSREDMAELTATAGQAGIAYKDLGKFMTLAAKASSAWDVSAKEAAESLAHIKAQTQWTIPELEKFADQVNYLGDNSASAEKNILEMFNRSAGAAKAAGVPLETALALTTALNSAGMQQEVTSRFVNTFSSRLRTANDQNKDAKKGFAALGYTPGQLEAGMKKDATKTMIEFLERLEKSQNKASDATKIFGREWWDEASRAGQALPEMRKNLGLLADGGAAGSLTKSLQTDLDTASSHVKRFGVLMSEVGDKLSNWALPTINQTIDSLIKQYEKDGFDYYNPVKALKDVWNSASDAPITAAGAYDAAKSAVKWPFSFSGIDMSSLNPLNDAGMRQVDALKGAFGSPSPPQAPPMRLTSAPIEASPARSGLVNFGLGGVGSGAQAALDPNNLIGGLMAAIKATPAPPVRLEGAAEIKNMIEVMPSPDFLVRVEQATTARGALRSDVGVSMPQ